MSDLLSLFATAFISLFAIVDAIGNAPVFLSLTPRNTHAERIAMAKKAAIAMFIILMVFAFLGNTIFRFFGITIDAFRVAGGMILLKISWDMLEVRPPRTRHTPEEDREGIAKEDVAIIPLAMPMLSGPGAISTVIVFSNAATSIPQMAALAAAIGLNALLVYFILRSSARLISILKETGLKIFTRILGIILASIAFQFILTGIRNFFNL